MLMNSAFHQPQKNGCTNAVLQMAGSSACSILGCILSMQSLIGKQKENEHPSGTSPPAANSGISTPQNRVSAVPHVNTILFH